MIAVCGPGADVGTPKPDWPLPGGKSAGRNRPNPDIQACEWSAQNTLFVHLVGLFFDLLD